jgi:hypothetical protein
LYELILIIYKIVGYKSKEDQQTKRTHSLIGTFVKEELEEIFDKRTVLFPFSLNFLHNKITFHAIKKDEKNGWIKALKDALGYANLYDYYELKVCLIRKRQSNQLGNPGKRQIWISEIGNSQENTKASGRENNEKGRHENE